MKTNYVLSRYVKTRQNINWANITKYAQFFYCKKKIFVYNDLNLKNKTMKDQIKKLWELINNSNKILLINHIRMDMDSFWSLSAMYDILKQKWKDVKAINDDEPLKSFNIIWYNSIIEPWLDISIFKPDLIISFDAASTSQLWNSYKDNEIIFNNTNFVVIDHHKTNIWFWDINIIQPNYSSTCELIFDIINILNFQNLITPKIATAIISGIYTDTNVFYNSNTTSNTHHVVSKLFNYWADFRTPYYEFYKKKTFNSSKLWWKILNSYMKISKNKKFCYAMITKDVFEKTNTTDRDLTWLISEFFANIEWIEICFIWYETVDDNIKVSFRSSPNYDISKICSYFWWWWHKQAAWFTSNKSLKETEKNILYKINETLWNN